MKNIFIIFNILIILMGNMLFPMIHHEHGDHDAELEHECEECLIASSNNNYIFYFEELNIQLCKSNLFIYENICIPKLNLKEEYLSRAPPIS